MCRVQGSPERETSGSHAEEITQRARVRIRLASGPVPVESVGGDTDGFGPRTRRRAGCSLGRERIGALSSCAVRRGARVVLAPERAPARVTFGSREPAQARRAGRAGERSDWRAARRWRHLRTARPAESIVDAERGRVIASWCEHRRPSRRQAGREEALEALGRDRTNVSATRFAARRTQHSYASSCHGLHPTMRSGRVGGNTVRSIRWH